jgi:hypothetical protein
MKIIVLILVFVAKSARRLHWEVRWATYCSRTTCWILRHMQEFHESKFNEINSALNWKLGRPRNLIFCLEHHNYNGHCLLSEIVLIHRRFGNWLCSCLQPIVIYAHLYLVLSIRFNSQRVSGSIPTANTENKININYLSVKWQPATWRR